MNTLSYKRGFTIVELLIVVAVIAILAALITVTYGGVQRSARDKAVLSDIDAVETELARYSVKNSGTYGSALTWYSGVNGGASTNPNIVFTPSEGSVIDVVTSTTQYCIRAYNKGAATYKDISSAAYKESVTGACTALPASSTAVSESPVAPQPPALPTITNLASNPGIETNQTGISGPNSSTVTRVTDRAHTGTASIRATMPIGGVTSVGAGLYAPGATTVPNQLEASTTYTASAWVYVPAATTVPIRLSIQGTARASATYPPATYSTTVKDQWVRLSASFVTTATSGSIVVYVLNTTATTVAGMQFWVDSVMLTKSDTLYDFADGNSAGWSWTGTQNNSTSSGPGVTSS